MAGQSGHNLSIARSKLGAPRLPFEQRDVGDGYAGAGPVTVRQMTPEERAKYGAPAEKERKSALTKAVIKWAVEHAGNLEAAAQKLNITARHLWYEMNRYCVPVPDNWEEDENMELATTDLRIDDTVSNETTVDLHNSADQTKPEGVQDAPFDRPKTRLELAREKLSRDVYQRLKEESISDSKICKQYDIAPDVMVALKKEWGVLSSEKKTEQKETTAGTCMTIAQVVQMREELIEDIDDFDRILNNTDAISPRIERLLKYYRDDYQRCLDRIEGVFNTTEVTL